MNTVKIAVIGLGYVGLPLSSLLAVKNDVIAFDVDTNKIQSIMKSNIPIIEPDLEKYLRAAILSKRLELTTDPSGIKDSDVKIITVGTPYNEVIDFIDYSQLESSLNLIIPYLKPMDVLVLKSTVPPGTTMGMVKSRIESFGFKVPEDIGLVFSPERMIEGQAIRDFQSLPKIIGASDDRSFSVTKQFMSELGGSIIRVSNPETAETVKMVDNYSRYVFLGLVNELALACEKIGVDVLEVIRAAKEDYTRNAGLLIPGPGVGGSCLNKDPFILRGILRKSSLELEMLKSASIVNSKATIHIAELVSMYRNSGSVTILGVAFKGDTDDTRFTPSFTIRDDLVAKGFVVKMVDPFVHGNGIYHDPYIASEGTGILLVVTDHSDYRSIDLAKLRSVMAENPLIIDTRGMIDRNTADKLGFEYHGPGRL